MKHLITILNLVFITSSLVAQQGHNKHRYGKNCEEYPNLTDSVYVYSWDNVGYTWNLGTVWQYESSDGNYDRLTFINVDILNRSVNYKWEYFYDENENRNIEIATFYREERWINRVKKESEFSEDNKKLNQLTYYWNDNKGWVPSKFFENEYNMDGTINSISYHTVNQDGNLSPVSVDIFTYEYDQLAEVRSYKESAESAYSIAKYSYNSDEQLFEIQYLAPENENPASFIQSRRFLYTYDEYSIRREFLKQNWNGETWENDLKYIYFTKLDHAKKVSICHNGHSQCISIHALPALLKNGAQLGKCDEETKGKYKSEKNDFIQEGLNPKKTIVVYPNPAVDQVTIKLPGNNKSKSERYRIEIKNIYGRAIRTYNVKNSNEFTFSRGNIENGQYLIRVTGAESLTSLIEFQ